MSEIGEIFVSFGLIIIIIFGFISFIPSVVNTDSFTQVIDEERTESFNGDKWITEASVRENVSVINGTLTLNNSSDSGTWVSRSFSYSANPIEPSDISYNSDLKGGDIELTYIWSDFQNFQPSNVENYTVVDGPGSIDLQNFNKTRYYKIRLDLKK